MFTWTASEDHWWKLLICYWKCLARPLASNPILICIY
jgi:hypothetical protein